MDSRVLDLILRYSIVKGGEICAMEDDEGFHGGLGREGG